MAEDDEATMDEADPTDEPFPLLIAVTASPTERIRLAERLDGIAPLLLVADLDELRRLIAAPQQVAAARPSRHPCRPWCSTRPGPAHVAETVRSCSPGWSTTC
ncbi:hypothetical protein GCM10027614_03270 [Micromonospora vulcania]